MVAATLNQALEIVTRLRADDQEELYELLRRSHIEAWRKSVATYAKKAKADFKAGKLKSYTAEELNARLRAQWESPDE